jgi:hypothetical protein
MFQAAVIIIILLLLFYLRGYSRSRGSNLMLKWTYGNNSVKLVYDLDVEQHVIIYDFDLVCTCEY